MAGRRAIGQDQGFCQLARTLPGAGSEEILPVRPLGEVTMRSRTAVLAAMLAIAPLGAKAASRAEHGVVAEGGEREGAIDVISGLVRWFGDSSLPSLCCPGVITGPSLAQARHPQQARTGRRKSASFWNCSTIPWCATGSRRSGTRSRPPAAAPLRRRGSRLFRRAHCDDPSALRFPRCRLPGLPADFGEPGSPSPRTFRSVVSSKSCCSWPGSSGWASVPNGCSGGRLRGRASGSTSCPSRRWATGCARSRCGSRSARAWLPLCLG